MERKRIDRDVNLEAKATGQNVYFQLNCSIWLISAIMRRRLSKGVFAFTSLPTMVIKANEDNQQSE